MNLISFSVYGQSKMYLQGALDNINAAEKYYPGWIPYFCVAKNCPVLSKLLYEENKHRCIVNIMKESNWVHGSTTNVKEHHNEAHVSMIDRYFAYFEENADIILTRDTDSRLNPREAAAIQDWLKTDYPICCIYDHPNHTNGIVMPGMMGIKKWIIEAIFPNGKKDYQLQLDRFMTWYSDTGYKMGLRWVHFDIHLICALIINRIGWDRVYKCGYNTTNPLNVPMPIDNSCGEYVGATVHEEWRNQLWQ